MKNLETTQYYLYADFEGRRIGITRNRLGLKVGDFGMPSAEIGKVLVYAIFNLSENGVFAVKAKFREICSRFAGYKFHEKLNNVVETLIELTGDEEGCKSMKDAAERMKEYREKQREKRAERVIDWLNNEKEY